MAETYHESHQQGKHFNPDEVTGEFVDRSLNRLPVRQSAQNSDPVKLFRLLI